MKVLMEFQRKKEKNNRRCQGDGESFDGIPEGVQVLKTDGTGSENGYPQQGRVRTISGKAH